MRALQICSLLTTLSLSACSSADTAPAAPNGQALYQQPFEDGNSFACASCHALEEPAADGIRRAGHAIGGATERPSFKNGQLTDMRDAVNSCLQEWMNADALEGNDPRWLALRNYLAAAGSSGVAITHTLAAPPAELDGGDAEAGEELFNGSCAHCHGQDATGTLQGPSLVGTSVDAATIARRIRTSGNPSSGVYDGLTGGIMPFWSRERLSDPELLDLIAYVEGRAQDLPAAMDASVGSDAGSNADASVPGDCPSTHADIAKSGTLTTFAHQVAGTVTVVNDCTLRVDNFTFDGGGIDVRWYAGVNQDFDNGFAISEDIFGTRYDNETVFLTIPEGKSLDDFNSVSVWCAAVGQNFGDTLLE